MVGAHAFARPYRDATLVCVRDILDTRRILGRQFGATGLPYSLYISRSELVHFSHAALMVVVALVGGCARGTCT